MKQTKELSMWSIAFPIIIQAIFQRLFGIVDTYALSHYSDNAVAGVGYSCQILNINFIVFQVIASGASILMAQAVGENNIKKQKYICNTSIFLSCLVGGGTSILIIYLRKTLLTILNINLTLFVHASDYLLVMGIGVTFSSILTTLTAIYRCIGKSHIISAIIIIFNCFNIIGDFMIVKGVINIYGIVKDLALVTVLANMFSCIVALIFLFHREKSKFFHNFSISIMKKIIFLGVPAAGETCSYNFSQMVCTIIIGSLGSKILTGRIYGMNFSSIMVLIPGAIAIATGIIVGIKVGEREVDEIRKTVFSCIKKGSIAIIIIDIPLLIFGKDILAMFTKDLLIQEVSYLVLCMEAITMFLKNINLILGNSLRAMSDVRYPVIISVISMWIVGTGICWGLGILMKGGIIGIYISFFLDETIRACLLFKRWIQKTKY